MIKALCVVLSVLLSAEDQSENMVASMDDIVLSYFVRLMLVVSLYSLPIIVLRIFKLEGFTKKKAWLISVLYTTLIWIIHVAVTAVLYSHGSYVFFEPLSARSLFIWILLNRFTLRAGRKNDDSNKIKSSPDEDKINPKPPSPQPLPDPSQNNLTSKQKQIFRSILEIIRSKDLLTAFTRDSIFVQATAYSLRKIPDDSKADSETMARRVLSRACYSVLAYRERNNIQDDGERLSNYSLYELMRDSLLWLLHSKFYSVERYDSIVKKINPVLIRLDIKKPVYQEPHNS